MFFLHCTYLTFNYFYLFLITEETIDYVLRKCKQLNHSNLRLACERNNLQVTVINLLMNNKLKLDMEKFISKNFK